MSRRSVDRARLDQLLEPRTHPFGETVAGEGTFTIDDGPVRDYTRSVAVERVDDDTWLTTETLTYKLAIPYFWWFFAVPIWLILHFGLMPFRQ